MPAPALTLQAALDFIFQELRSGDEPILPRLEREMIARAVDADAGGEIKIAKRLGLTKAALQKKLREA
jgi:two-component system nitrogen regulation response regulator GlnG